jgi:hypothetical protein
MLKDITSPSARGSRSVVVVSAIDSRTGEPVHAFYYNPHGLQYLHDFFGDYVSRTSTPLRIAEHYCPAAILRILDAKEFDETEANR